MFPTGVFQENNPLFGAVLFTGSRKSQPFAMNFGPGRTEAASKVRLSPLLASACAGEATAAVAGALTWANAVGLTKAHTHATASSRRLQRRFRFSATISASSIWIR